MAIDELTLLPLQSRSPRSAPSGGGVVKTLLVAYGVMTAAMLVIGFLLTDVLDGSVGAWDTDVNRWFADHRTGALNALTGFATVTLNTLPVIGVAAIVVALLVWRHRWREALVIVFGLVLEITVFLSVTFVVDRPRPDVVRLNSAPMTSSFPSGHTAAAVVLYGGIALIASCCTERRALRVLAWIVVVGAASAVALSCVYRGMHHPTDVLVAVAFGAACLYAAVLAVRAIPERKPVESGRDETFTERPTDVRPPEPIEWDVVA